MNRESFFARRPATSTVTLADGATVQVRKLSQAEVETLQKRYSGEDKALEGFRYVVSRAALDDDGKRLFEDADQQKLTEFDFETIQTIALEIMKFSGLKVDAKNA